MKTNRRRPAPHTVTLVLSAACLLSLGAPYAHAQDAPSGASAAAQSTLSQPVRLIPLHNMATQADQNELLTAVRNMLSAPSRIFLVPSQNIIAFRGSEQDFADAQKLVAELDKPRKLYRLTFTLKDSDEGKPLGKQHFSVVVVDGQRVQLKEGSRVPVITGSYGAPAPAGATQFTYLDVGMNFDATISQQANGLYLRSKIERSSVAEEKGVYSKEDPIIRQSTIEGTSLLTLDKPLTLGSLDSSGSTRRVDIEVTAELAK